MAHVGYHESTWLERQSFDEAEHDFHTHNAKTASGQQSTFKLFDPHYHHPNHPHHKSQSQGQNSISGEIAKAREHIRKTLIGVDKSISSDPNSHKMQALEKQVVSLTSRLDALEKFCHASCKSSCSSVVTKAANSVAAAPSAAEKDDEDEDDFELFGSEEEEEADAAAEKLKQQRIAAYQAKKGKKPVLVAKSTVIFDVKPWDDETDMKQLENCVRSVVMDGLLWGASKLVPLAYGIKKFQIMCVIEDDKVSTEVLEETITAFEDLVQSVDIAAFNKI